ncbi:MAG TPA: AAA family ATPase, partial [Polyangium sp.]|nr:AAA family ATPase [Polyangium sp.]
LSKQADAPKAIFVTGDIGEKGRHYDDARQFLEKLAAACSLSLKDVYLVPGNHDVDLDSGGLLVQQLVQGSQNGDADSFDKVLRDSETRKVLARRFKHFIELSEQCGSGSDLYWSKVISNQPISVRVIGINTVFLWSGNEEGKLRIGQAQLTNIGAAQDELVLALSHHPIDSAYLQDARLVRLALDTYADAHLSSASYLGQDWSSLTGERNPAQLRAGGRASDRQLPWGYYIASVLQSDDGQRVLRAWPRRWSIVDDFRLDVLVAPDGQSYVDMPLGERRMRHEAPPTPKKWPGAQQIPFIEGIRLHNIGPILAVDWTLASEPGWNVMIGDNGSGKTSFLRMLSYGLVASSTYSTKTEKDESDRLPFDARHLLHDKGSSFAIEQRSEPSSPTASVPTFGLEFTGDDPHLSYALREDLRGMFCASFGPFRRFTGGDEGYEKEILQFPRVFRHLSLFTERIAFYESVRWLRYLQLKALSDESEAPLLAAVKRFINNDQLFPNGVRLEKITADAITFTDSNGFSVPLERLSDGFRSVLSLSLELVRQLVSHYGREQIFDADTGVVIAPGIVIIDEVDVHLHPTWQREIGLRLRKLFPQIQFIVTTHSALVCQAAADGHGSIFRLPKPGTDEVGRVLDGPELNRILYGNVLDAYGTGVFGSVERSEQGAEKRKRLVELNLKEVSEGLSPDEEREQDELRSMFPTGK